MAGEFFQCIDAGAPLFGSAPGEDEPQFPLSLYLMFWHVLIPSSPGRLR